LAIAVGASIGWERQSERKPAGLRTHMLVSLGSALFILSSLQVGAAHPTSDTISRVIQGIASGIGFLGAGEIVSKSAANSINRSHEIKVQGLTSAAAIWVSASLGVASACGLWLISLVGAVSALIILWGVKKIE
jgi:putative Mg2+ transporter-C (MgtC) family protein